MLTKLFKKRQQKEIQTIEVKRKEIQKRKTENERGKLKPKVRT